MLSFASRVSKRRGAEKAPYLCNLETAKNGVGAGGREWGGAERGGRRHQDEKKPGNRGAPCLRNRTCQIVGIVGPAAS